jgi:hypothetical protein
MSFAMSAIQGSISACEVPSSALLRKYVYEGAYTDCYVTGIGASVSQAEYVEAFYTTAVFKFERLILTWLASMPSSDSDARRLANAEIDSFAAWSVEERAPNQLLLRDFQHRTRSWLMVAPIESGEAGTRLYFGSAVVPVRRRSGEATLGFTFSALLGFHQLYSRILLRAARSRLAGRRRAGGDNE